MQPFNKVAHGWQLTVGPLVIRPDRTDPKRRTINFYWNGNYALTVAPCYLIVKVGSKSHVWLYFDGLIRHGVILHVKRI